MKNLTKKLKVFVVVLGILVIASTAYLFKISFFKSPAKEEIKLPEQGNLEKPEKSKDLDKILVDLMDYKVYKFDDIDFKFVIAKIRVKAEGDSINVSLSNFRTSEGILLDQVDAYVQQLENKQYFLGKQNVWFELISTDSSYLANIFIPIKDGNQKDLIVDVNLGEKKQLKFDLTKTTSDSKLLKYVADDVISDGKTYQMKVSKAYDITGEEFTVTFDDGYSEEYVVPSTSQIYSFDIEAVSLWGDELVIENARYVTDTSEVFEALPINIQSNKYVNLVGLKITDKSMGSLFFMTLNPSKNPITHKGTLHLKIKGQINEIIINVDL